MKWYETPLIVQWNNALELLKRGRKEDYVKAVKRVLILCVEREKQMHVDLEMSSALARYQGIDALLHMKQSKLRVMTDDDLVISRMGLMCDCAALELNSDRPSAKQKRALARQAFDKILREMQRRIYVYSLDDSYYCY
nr:MAG TPA: hypothetical protein [Bacteriophage sp.]